MSGVVFDTGALIALERNVRSVMVLVAEAQRGRDTITIPAACVAQAWRRPERQARLATFLRLPNVRLVALDDAEARLVGLLLARTRSRDIVDGHVAVCAARLGQVVLTSDAADLARLAPQIRTVQV